MHINQIRCYVALAFLAVDVGLGRNTAQSYPAKTIKLVVPFGPGGPTDVAARVASQVLAIRARAIGGDREPAGRGWRDRHQVGRCGGSRTATRS